MIGSFLSFISPGIMEVPFTFSKYFGSNPLNSDFKNNKL
jgi:hypothetical protein